MENLEFPNVENRRKILKTRCYYLYLSVTLFLVFATFFITYLYILASSTAAHKHKRGDAMNYHSGIDGSYIIKDGRKIYENSVLITVYYDSNCKKSCDFLMNQLLPVIDIIQIDIETELIPYPGFSGNLNFNITDKVLTCIDRMYSGAQKIEIITCIIRSTVGDFNVGAEQCCNDNDSWEQVKLCANELKYDELLKSNDKLKNDTPANTTLNSPTVFLNSKLTNQTALFKNFTQEICKAATHKLD